MSRYTPAYRASDRGLAGRLDCLTPGFRPDPHTFEASYCRIYYWANKQANSGFPYLPLSETYEQADIEEILKLYVQAVQGGQTPQYSDLKITSYKPNVTGTVIAKGDAEQVVSFLTLRSTAAKKYKQPSQFVRVVLYWMDRLAYTYSGESPEVHPGLAWPATADARQPNDPIIGTYYEAQMDAIKRESESSFFGEANSFLRNILWIGVGIGAIYLLGPIIVGAIKR